MKKRIYFKLIAFGALFISSLFFKGTSLIKGNTYSFGFVSMPYYCAVTSNNENECETEVIAHIDPVNSEQTATPDSSGSALTQKDEDTSKKQPESSKKTGKPARTGDLLFEQILLLSITVILSFAVILLLRLRHKAVLMSKDKKDY